MLDQLISCKCKASTILETLVAALILLISFSAGLAIYNKVLLAGLLLLRFVRAIAKRHWPTVWF